MVADAEAITADSLFAGKLIVHQPREGYRFSIDAVLLAGLAGVRQHERVVDLGTGCGVIPLILAYRNQGRCVVGVEIQPELAELAERNVSENGFSGRIEIISGDFRKVHNLLKSRSSDIVLSNPPYRRQNSGRINLNYGKAIARHELSGSIADVFAAANYLLPHGGRIAVIYPAKRLGRLFEAARMNGFSPKNLTMIHSDVSGHGRLVFLESRKGGGEELKVSSPFFIYNKEGKYTEAMSALYEH